MKIYQKELESCGYTLRGILTTPDNKTDKLVVMFHGFTGCITEAGFMFKNLAIEFAKNQISSIRYDFMGSGESDGLFSDFTINTQLEDAKNIINEAYNLNNNEKIILLGFSMGAAVASLIARNMQDKIEKLVLISPAGNMPEIVKERSFEHDNKYQDFDMGGFVLSKKFMEIIDNFDMYEDIEKFTNPVIIIQGSKDISVPPIFSEKYHELYKNSTYYMIEGAGHGYSTLSFRKKLNETILEFINKN